jgi:replication factor C subunit 3/5
MARHGDIPHMLVHGPAGAGKKTRVAALLRALHGTAAAKVRAEQRTLRGSSGSTTAATITIVASNYHAEINPSDAGTTLDRTAIQDIITAIATTRPIQGATTPAGMRGTAQHRTVVIHEADRLSRGAQDALRRTMERHARGCRLVLVATAACRVAPAIRSRCCLLRVPHPPQHALAAALVDAAHHEGVALPHTAALRIAAAAGCNARKAMLMLEATVVRAATSASLLSSSLALAEDVAVERADWEEYVAAIAMDVAQEQTPRRLAEVRMRLYELLTHCIPPDVVLKQLALELMRKVDSQLQYDLVTWAAFYVSVLSPAPSIPTCLPLCSHSFPSLSQEHRIHLGTKPIYHIEAFIAKFMCIFNRFLLDVLA